MASSKKRKVDKEGQKFNERWKFDYFLLRVAIIAFASFANSRHYETKLANSYQRFLGSKREDKIKQLEASLASQHSSGQKSQMKTLPEQAMRWRSLSLNMENLSLRNRRNIIKIQVTEQGCNFDNLSLACDESADWRGIDNDLNITEELLQAQGTDTRCGFTAREIGQFVDEKGYEIKELSNPKWLADVAFVTDITKHLNALNVFKEKMQHPSQNESNTSHFPALQEVMDCFPQETCGKICKSNTLSADFTCHFKDFAIIEQDMHLFLSPFSVDPVDAPHELQLELIDLQCHDDLRHQQLSLTDFDRHLNKEKFPKL
ncbi:General transcription factor II-I repeat domain-containing protein 2 [Labeo rohita]|uniref:General transcription factor II-I repeat domain-containing protein 2 n=1 Tax=Labeo rohita TaxID=84645 RepID=A0ABQ8M517_LABRO|nr:General transcription factor II-I repeat domain-containing protein 2 [Labeo rohita]